MKKIRKQEDGMFWYCGMPYRKSNYTKEAREDSWYNWKWGKLVRSMEKIGITIYSDID